MKFGFGEITTGQKRLLILLAVIITYGIIDVILNKDAYTSAYFSESQYNDLEKDLNDQSEATGSFLKIYTNISKAYAKDWGRNPFTDIYQPPVEKQQPKLIPKKQPDKIHFSLEGISLHKNRSIAMINGKILFIGDFIQEFRVIEINDKHVILKKHDKNYLLTLK